MLTLNPQHVRKPRDWTPTPPAPPRPVMTEREFVAWAYAGENIRAEWENGKVITMAPVSAAEDDLNNSLLSILRIFCEERDFGTVKGSQFMVRFARQKRRRMPDLMFISKARQNLIKPTHLEGAPDVAFEIVSADSQTRDRRKKFIEYQKAGVREYWIIDPLSQQVELYSLNRGAYVEVEPIKHAWHSVILQGFYLKDTWLWHTPMPKLSAVLKELGVLG
jgi:Uma2 family endonuclease